MKVECPGSQGTFLSQQRSAFDTALGQNLCYPLSMLPMKPLYKDSTCPTCKIKAIFTVKVQNKAFVFKYTPPFLL